MNSDNIWFTLENTEGGKPKVTGLLQELKVTGVSQWKGNLAGKLRVNIYQNREGDKGNEGESKKREPPRPKWEEKTVPWHLPSGLFQAHGKNRKNEKEAVNKLDYQRESVTHLFLPGKAGAAGIHPAQMTKWLA